MDEPSAELERAGAMVRGEWDAARIERTLLSAKRRRVRRTAVRGVGLISGAGVLLFLWLAPQAGDSTTASRGARPLAPSAPQEPSPTQETKQAAVEPERASPPLPTPAEPEGTSVRSREARVRIAATDARARKPSWRSHMREGDARAAYAILRVEQPKLSTLDDLMLAADAARRAGDPRAATGYLEQALRDHPGPRSAVVAFTLGRILRDELSRPADAARAFSQVEQSSKDAPLAEDALAREVEAWQAAKSRERAKQRARDYVQRYPQGERRAWMERLLQTP